VTAALCFVANQVSRGQVAAWGTFVIGLRRYGAKGLAVGLINLVGVGLIVVNLGFYGALVQGDWTVFAAVAWAVVAVYWLLVQVFWFPMILEMKNERVFLALRNALGLVFISPGFSLTMALLIFLLGALFIVLSVPAVVFMASFFLLLFNHATRSRLAHVRKEPYQPGVIEPDPPRRS
jgi:uncharacterized membrane protein YesL